MTDKIHMENGSTITLVKSKKYDKWQGCLTNNQLLRRCITDFHSLTGMTLSRKAISLMSDVSLHTVNSWLLPVSNKSFRRLPDERYKLFHKAFKRLLGRGNNLTKG